MALAAFAGGLVGVNPKLGVALVGTVALVALALARRLVGGLILVGLVPVASGLAPGVPVASVRISEALIGVVGVTLIVSVRRRDSAPGAPSTGSCWRTGSPGLPLGRPTRWRSGNT